MGRRRKFLVLLVVLFMGAYVAGIALNVAPWLRGPALLVGGYALFVAWWMWMPPQASRPAGILLPATLAAVFVQWGLPRLSQGDVRNMQRHLVERGDDSHTSTLVG